MEEIEKLARLYVAAVKTDLKPEDIINQVKKAYIKGAELKEKELLQTKEELKHSRNWEKEQHSRHMETIDGLLKQREELKKEKEALQRIIMHTQQPWQQLSGYEYLYPKNYQEIDAENERLKNQIQELLEENKRLKESFTPSIPPLCVCKKKESSSVVTYCDGNCL